MDTDGNTTERVCVGRGTCGSAQSRLPLSAACRPAAQGLKSPWPLVLTSFPRLERSPGQSAGLSRNRQTPIPEFRKRATGRWEH